VKGLWDYLVYGIVVAGILVLTRPGSQGPSFVRALGGSLVGFAQAVSGQKVSSKL
jgi:hypothetical protein